MKQEIFEVIAEALRGYEFSGQSILLEVVVVVVFFYLYTASRLHVSAKMRILLEVY